jgi:hypothetical protein
VSRKDPPWQRAVVKPAQEAKDGPQTGCLLALPALPILALWKLVR